MMRRPEQHKIDTLAQRLFESALPSDLIVRWQHADDYGVDAEIEYFEKDQTTGAIFKIQLKGTKNPNYVREGEFLSFSFELDKAEYLIEQVEIPTAIIRCDVKNKAVYWVDVHANYKLLQDYEIAKSNGQKNLHNPFQQ